MTKDFSKKSEVEEYYTKLSGIFIADLLKPDQRGLILDLNSLPSQPVDLKNAVIKWLITVNLDRLRRKEEPIITLELVLKCPVWRVIKPPVRSVRLTKEGLFGRPKIKTLRQKAVPGRINKR